VFSKTDCKDRTNRIGITHSLDKSCIIDGLMGDDVDNCKESLADINELNFLIY
jgi:hypothetical protein